MIIIRSNLQQLTLQEGLFSPCPVEASGVCSEGTNPPTVKVLF